MRKFAKLLLFSSFFYLLSASSAQTPPEALAPLRAPATPLVVHDPYFSIWSMTDHLNGGSTRHWTGVEQALTGLIRVDNTTFRFLGSPDKTIPALKETRHTITPTRTIAVFKNAQIELQLCFLTPAFPDDMRILSRPVTYLTFTVRSLDNAQHDVALYFDADAAIATDTRKQPVVWSRDHVPGLNLLRVGTEHQRVLEKWGDDVRIDWGYCYVAVPEQQGTAFLAAGSADDRRRFIQQGILPEADDLEQPRMPQSRHPSIPLLNVAFPLAKVGPSALSRHLLLSYDDIYSVEFMHQRLLPYWRKESATFGGMLQLAEHDYPALQQRAEAYDAELQRDLFNVGGPEYAAIAVLAFRQAIAAHKLVEDENGVPFFMPKENFSNGSISTVDVLYPSAPMFLLLNPKLVEAQLEPVMRYAGTTHWKFPFAPHDLGVYPLANGQQYGGGEISEDDQMPVEESGNIILMFDALAHAEHSADYATRYWTLLSRWADFLLAKGFDPENQLCTDDFAGHLAHNTNLSIKAIEALAAYAQLAHMRGDSDAAKKYGDAAKSMAAAWVQRAADADHYRLAFDAPGTWSQKYNLVWDQILDLHMFPQTVAAKEIAFYKTKMDPFGLPLDNRRTYTKLDWTIWTATLATTPADFQTFVHPVFLFLNQTPDRVPMTDWYDTVSAHMVGFQARSVVGGVYIKALGDPALWKKWSERAQPDPR